MVFRKKTSWIFLASCRTRNVSARPPWKINHQTPRCKRLIDSIKRKKLSVATINGEACFMPLPANITTTKRATKALYNINNLSAIQRSVSLSIKRDGSPWISLRFEKSNVITTQATFRLSLNNVSAEYLIIFRVWTIQCKLSPRADRKHVIYSSVWVSTH